MFGLLPINKSTGISSRQAVDVVKRLVRPAKIGHTGTLDPLASGVLVLCIGPATRLANYVQALSKSYVGDFQLGVQSDSDDCETPLVPVPASPEITINELEPVLQEFIGKIEQVPPAYSAVKIKGQRAYRISRAGKSVDIEPRTVSIHSIELIEFSYPNFRMKIKCGSGTYIRSLGRDIGKRLRSGAVMTSLVRDSVGTFSIESALETNSIDHSQIEKHLVNPLSLFRETTRVTLDVVQFNRLRNGQFFSGHELGLSAVQPEQVAATDENGDLVALLSRNGQDSYKPDINFAHYYVEKCDN